MAVHELLPGVYRIGMGYVSAYLIARDEVTLIDSGLPKKRKTLLAALAEARRGPEELRHVLITHHHADHAGSLAAIAKATQARTYVHPLDAPVVRGDVPQPGPNPASLAGRFLGPIVHRLPQNRLRPARVDHELQDGEELPAAGGIRVVHTPGHTAGHVSFLWPEGSVLFVGDAAANLFGRLGKPSPMFTEDLEQAKESMRKIAELEFDMACFGHGNVIQGEAHAAFRRYTEKMAR
jgi:glyoxylase-like metal-dependent hydrolase (beta-lactamase superfamily II)